MKNVGLIVGCLLLSVVSYGSDPYDLYNLYGGKKKNTSDQYYQLLLNPNQAETPTQSPTTDQPSVTATSPSVETPMESTPIVTEPTLTEQVTQEIEKSPQDFFQDGSSIEYFMVDQRYKNSLKAQKHKAKMEAIPSYHFLMLNGSYAFNKSGNIGFTYGWCHAVGFYVNMMFGVSGGHYQANDLGVRLGWEYRNSDIQLTNEHTHQRISITPGLMVRLGCPLYLNIGLGYAYSTQTNKATNGRWYSIYPGGGVSFQLGLMANIKKCSLMFSYGLAGLEYPSQELMLGVGVALNGKKGGKQ